jgi:predicted SnoaL-like aldol condensation-catalyzing enzyme
MQSGKVVEGFLQEVIVSRRLDKFYDYVDRRYIDHDPPIGGRSTGRSFYNAVCSLVAPPSDVHFIVERLISDGDYVCASLFGEGYIRRPYRLDADRRFTVFADYVSSVGTGSLHLTMSNVSLFRANQQRIVERWGPIQIKWSEFGGSELTDSLARQRRSGVTVDPRTWP